jgi:methylthioribose-1-phosphate isomerase
VAAGYGMVVAAQALGPEDDLLAGLQRAAAYLKSCRPTAVNLAWAADRVLSAAQRAPFLAPRAVRDAMLEEAREIHAEDIQLCHRIGQHAAALIARCRGVLTHCNAGALATAGIGTATAGMYVAHAAGHRFTVYCDETRPLLQGSRLTAWELMQAGIDAVVITDNMAAKVMRDGRVQMVITGADRIAANGDAANKIGTYSLAVAARHHGVPFYVAAPASTFDRRCPDGSKIVIEERAAEEVLAAAGWCPGAPGSPAAWNPAFDVTPAELVTAIVTDRGVLRPPYGASIAEAFRQA